MEDALSNVDDVVEFGDLIIKGMAGPIELMSSLFCNVYLEVKGPNGTVIIDCPDEDSECDFKERLVMIVKSASDVIEMTGADRVDVLGRMFALDGWTWNENIFRSPIWMDDHREIKIEDARKIEGMEWLTGSSLEKRFEPNKG